MEWKPVLDGASADEAHAVIVEIARALARDGECKRTDAALFWAYIAGELDEPWVEDAYAVAVEALAEDARSGFDDISLFRGAAGAGFVIAHISEQADVAESLTAIDEAIDVELGALAMPAHLVPYDLVGGFVGIGVYLLERIEHSLTARRALARIVEHLAATSERIGSDFAWYTRAEQLTAQQRAMYPQGFFNCGLAHGIAGVVSVLARIASQTIDPPLASRARELATGGYRWLMQQRLPERSRSCFPGWIDRQRGASATRTAWCYGDPGTATVLWDAARRLGLSTDDAIEVAREAAGRDADLCGIEDAGFCHGTAGLGHIFNRWYQVTHDEMFRVAARAWFERTLDRVIRDRTNEAAWLPQTSLLAGVSGIGLSLLSAIAPVEPAWDRYFLVDLHRDR